MSFTLESIHKMPQIFFILQNILVFTKAYSCNYFFLLALFTVYINYHHLPKAYTSLALMQQILQWEKHPFDPLILPTTSFLE